MHLVYLRLGSIYLEEKEVRRQQGCGGEVTTNKSLPRQQWGQWVSEPHGNRMFWQIPVPGVV